MPIARGGWKICANPNCKQRNPQPVSNFTKHKASRDGLYPRCRSCKHEWREANKDKENARTQAWRERNREHCREYSRQYRKTFPEKVRAAKKRWETNNPDKVKAHKRKEQRRNAKQANIRVARYAARHPDRRKLQRQRYRENNRERINANARKYASENRGIMRAKEHRRRARKMEASGSHTAAEEKQLFEAYGNRCLCCDRDDIELTLDHVIPLVLGGSDEINNCQPLCRSCNSAKGIGTTDYRVNWRKEKPYHRQLRLFREGAVKYAMPNC